MSEREKADLSAGSDEAVDARQRRSKKAYNTPKLQEWGSILDLTLGLKAGSEDGGFPPKGTQPI